MYAKSTRPNAKRDDRIARLRRAQTCARGARWECAREAGRFLLIRLCIRGKICQVYQMKKFDVTDYREILQECCINIKQQKRKRIFRYHQLLLKYRAANFAI